MKLIFLTLQSWWNKWGSRRNRIWRAWIWHGERNWRGGWSTRWQQRDHSWHRQNLYTRWLWETEFLSNLFGFCAAAETTSTDKHRIMFNAGVFRKYSNYRRVCWICFVLQMGMILFLTIIEVIISRKKRGGGMEKNDNFTYDSWYLSLVAGRSQNQK